jgi:hypothetical protein
MYGLTTLAKINREADEAHRIVASHNLQAQAPVVSAPAPRTNPQETINRILEGSKG